MLQHEELSFSKEQVCEAQTLIDNVTLLPEETWEQVATVIVEFGRDTEGCCAVILLQ